MPAINEDKNNLDTELKSAAPYYVKEDRTSNFNIQENKLLIQLRVSIEEKQALTKILENFSEYRAFLEKAKKASSIELLNNDQRDQIPVQNMLEELKGFILTQQDNMVQAEIEEAEKIQLQLINYITMLRAGVAEPLPILGPVFSIAEVGSMFRKYEELLLTRLQKMMQENVEFAEVKNAFDRYEKFVNDTDGASREFNPADIRRNEDLIQNVYGVYAEFLIAQLRQELEKFASEENTQKDALEESIKNLLKNYLVILGKSFEKPISLSPAFFDKEFIKKLQPHLRLQDAIYFSIYAQGVKLGADAVKNYIDCFKGTFNTLLTDEYALRQKMQQNLVRGSEVMGTVGMDAVKGLLHGAQFISALNEYEDFYKKNNLEFSAEVQSMTEHFTAKKIARAKANSKANLRSGLFKNGVNTLSALSLSTVVLNLQEEEAFTTEQEIGKVSRGFGILERSADDIPPQVDHESEQTMAALEIPEGNLQKKDIKQLLLGIETYFETIEDDAKRFSETIRYVSELMDKLDDSNEIAKEALRDAILSFLLNSQVDDRQIRIEVLYHFTHYPQFESIFDKYLNSNDASKIDKIISYLKSNHCSMREPFIDNVLDQLFQKTNFSNDEKVQKLFSEIKVKIKKHEMTHEGFKILGQVIQKESVLNSALKDVKKHYKDHENLAKATNALIKPLINNFKNFLEKILSSILTLNRVAENHSANALETTGMAFSEMDKVTSGIKRLVPVHTTEKDKETTHQEPLHDTAKSLMKGGIGASAVGAAVVSMKAVFIPAAIAGFFGGIGAAIGGLGVAMLLGGAAYDALKSKKPAGEELLSKAKNRSCFSFFGFGRDKSGQKANKNESLSVLDSQI